MNRSKSAEELMNDVSDETKSTLDNAKEAYDELGEEVRSFTDRITDDARKLWDEVQPTVERHPLATAGIALLVGAAAGAITVAALRRRPTASENFRKALDAGREGWNAMRGALEKNIRS